MILLCQYVIVVYRVSSSSFPFIPAILSLSTLFTQSIMTFGVPLQVFQLTVFVITSLLLMNLHDIAGYFIWLIKVIFALYLLNSISMFTLNSLVLLKFCKVMGGESISVNNIKAFFTLNALFIKNLFPIYLSRMVLSSTSIVT